MPRNGEAFSFLPTKKQLYIIARLVFSFTCRLEPLPAFHLRGAFRYDSCFAQVVHFQHGQSPYSILPSDRMQIHPGVQNAGPVNAGA